jgi:serine/threonine protein kinase
MQYSSLSQVSYPLYNSLSEFSFIKKIGKGAFSRVYLVRHTNGKYFALKHIEYGSLHKTDKNNIQNEIKIHKRISHPNIVKFYNYFFDEGDLFLVLEYCSDGNLFQKIHQRKKSSPFDIHSIFEQIVDGIDYLHKNKILLRDLKPENVVLDGDKAKLCDFGWAVEFNNLAWRKKEAGTFAYMSPESLLGQLQDTPSDVWSLGVLYFEMKTKDEVFSQKNPYNQVIEMKKNVIKFNDSFSTWEIDFVKNMLKFFPEDRTKIEDIKNLLNKKNSPKLNLNNYESSTTMSQKSIVDYKFNSFPKKIIKLEEYDLKKKSPQIKKQDVSQSSFLSPYKTNLKYYQSDIYTNKESLTTKTTQKDSFDKSSEYSIKKEVFCSNLTSVHNKDAHLNVLKSKYNVYNFKNNPNSYGLKNDHVGSYVQKSNSSIYLKYNILK